VGCSGAVTLGEFAELTGDALAGGALTISANAVLNGIVDAIGAVSIAAKAVLFGDVHTQAALTLGAEGNLTGNSYVGAAATLAAGAFVDGDVAAKLAVGLGAGALVTGNVYAGGAVVLGADAKITTGDPLPAIEIPASGVLQFIEDVKLVQKGLQERPGAKDLNTALAESDDTLPAGTYFHSAAWALAAGRTITFDGIATDIWTIRIDGAVALAGNIALKGGAQASNIFWAVGAAFSLGAKSTCYGTVIATAGISIAASAKLYGRLFSTMGACDIAALALVEPTKEMLSETAHNPVPLYKAGDSDSNEVLMAENLVAGSTGNNELVGNAAAPARAAFPYLEVAIAVVAFLVLIGAGLWYQRKVRQANSKVLAVVETKKVGDARSYVNTHTHTHLHTHAPTHILTHTHTHAHSHTHTHEQRYTKPHVHARRTILLFSSLWRETRGGATLSLSLVTTRTRRASKHGVSPCAWRPSTRSDRRLPIVSNTITTQYSRLLDFPRFP
jgi:predicted acyltransferase (DUF342 family)